MTSLNGTSSSVTHEVFIPVASYVVSFPILSSLPFSLYSLSLELICYSEGRALNCLSKQKNVTPYLPANYHFPPLRSYKHAKDVWKTPAGHILNILFCCCILTKTTVAILSKKTEHLHQNKQHLLEPGICSRCFFI